MLKEFLPAEIFAFLIIFCRIGATIMILPGIGEAYVAPRVRLSLALLISALVAPLAQPSLPPEPLQVGALAVFICAEIAIGLFIGAAARLAISVFQVAGTIIAFQSSLGFGSFYDPTQGGQSAIIAAFLSLLGITAIFAADLHHLTLRAVIESYLAIPPLGAIPIGDFVQLGGQMVSGAFKLGIQISAPFLVYGVVFNIGLGALNRLMPAIQISFIVMPLQIALAFILLAGTLSATTLWFLEYYANNAAMFPK